MKSGIKQTVPSCGCAFESLFRKKALTNQKEHVTVMLPFMAGKILSVRIYSQFSKQKLTLLHIKSMR